MCYLSFSLSAVVHLLGLPWHLKRVEGELYENGMSKDDQPLPGADFTFTPVHLPGLNTTQPGMCVCLLLKSSYKIPIQL